MIPPLQWRRLLPVYDNLVVVAAHQSHWWTAQPQTRLCDLRHSVPTYWWMLVLLMIAAPPVVVAPPIPSPAPSPTPVPVVGPLVVASGQQGNVTTIAQTTSRPHGVHIDPSTGVVLFTQHHSLQRIHTNGTVEVLAGSGTSGTTDGIGPAASFDTPWGIAAGVRDPSRVHVVDHANHCLRRVDLATRNVTTFAGLCGASGPTDGVGVTARFYSPAGMALFHNTTSGMDVYLYVADRNNHIVRRVEIATVTVTTFAGTAASSGAANGPRTSTARLFNPYGVTVDPTGRWVYVADSNNNCIRRIDAISGSNGMVTTLAGLCGSGNNGFVDDAGEAARVEYPYDLTLDPSGSMLYVADTYNCAIRRINITDGNVRTVSGLTGCSGAGLVDGPLATARFFYPYAIQHYRLRTARSSGGVVQEEGLVVADYNDNAIRRITLDLESIATDTRSCTTSDSHHMISLSSTVSLPGTASITQSPTDSDTPRQSASPTEPQTTSSSVSASALWTASVPSASTSHSPSRTSTWVAGTASATVSLSASGGETCSPASATVSAPRPMASSTTSNTMSATESRRGDADTPWSVSFSGTASDSSWACGAYDPRNVSLAERTPSTTFDTASSARRIIFVSAAASEGTTTTTTAPAAPTSKQLAGVPLPRVALLTTHPEDTPLLLLGLSLRWARAVRWGVVSAVSVRHGDEVLTFDATTVSSPLSPGATLGIPHEIAVLLWPPPSSPNGWVPPGLEPVHTETEIVLELGLVCAAEGGNTSGGRAATVRVVVPAPGHPRELAEKVETTATVAQWTTAAGGPGAGSAVGVLPRYGAWRCAVAATEHPAAGSLA